MDEPFSSLDEEAAIQMRHLLKKLLKDQSTTVIFVTHNHDEANELSDRLIDFSAAPARILRDMALGSKKGR